MSINFKKIFILMGLLCASYIVKAQLDLSRKVTVNHENERLRQVIADLNKRFKLNFSYSSDEVPLDRKITVKLYQQPLRAVLDEIAAKAGLDWKQVGSQIILKIRVKRTSGNTENPELFQTVRGIILDKESQITIPGASVRITSLLPEKGTSSDADGNFRFNSIPVGRHELQVTAVGYQKVMLPQLLVSSGKELVLTVEMTESVTGLDAVIISDSKDRHKPLNEMAAVSARSFSVEETGRYAAGVFDPARMALSFAGVTAGNDLNNDIVIRGNSSKGLQWRLEGVEIINPNHFGEEGSSAGGISMISSSMLSNSDFFTGAFPAEYGNAISGVFDLQFRKGNTEKNEYAVMAGLLGTEIAAEGPFKKGGRSSYLINYRYSTLAMLEKLGVSPFGNGLVPVYQDLAYNFNFPTEKAGTFSLFGIGGISRQEQEAERDIVQWEDFDDKFDRDFGYYSGSTGLKHFWVLNGKIYLKNIISYSGSRIVDNADTLTNTYQANVFSRDSYKNTTVRYSGMINFKADAKNTFRSGAVISLLQFDLSSLAYRRSIDRLSQVLNADGNTWNHEIYSQWKHQFNDRLSINTGLHASYFNLSSSWSAEPRFGLNWQVKPDQQLSFGAGIHSRLEPMAFYFASNELSDGTAISSNKNLSPSKALHIVGGYEKIFSGSLKFKAEAYYQHLFDVPVSSDPAYSFSALNTSDAYAIYSRNYRPLVNEGLGKNTGLELTLEKPLDKGYYFLLTSSVFDSKFKTIDRKEFSTNFNSRYAGSFVSGKEWKTGKNDKNLLGINTKVMYTGGRRYTPINLAESIRLDDNIVYEDLINTEHTAPYFRIDLSMTCRINRPRITHAVFVDIQNVTDRRNELGRYYNSDKQKVETVQLSGMVPSVYYRVEF